MPAGIIRNLPPPLAPLGPLGFCVVFCVVINFDGFIIMNMGALIGWLGRPWDPTLACLKLPS